MAASKRWRSLGGEGFYVFGILTRSDLVDTLHRLLSNQNPIRNLEES